MHPCAVCSARIWNRFPAQVIQRLWLGSNDFGKDGGPIILNAICESKSLLAFDVSNNSIDSGISLVLQSAVSACATLQVYKPFSALHCSITPPAPPPHPPPAPLSFRQQSRPRRRRRLGPRHLLLPLHFAPGACPLLYRRQGRTSDAAVGAALAQSDAAAPAGPVRLHQQLPRATRVRIPFSHITVSLFP